MESNKFLSSHGKFAVADHAGKSVLLIRFEDFTITVPGHRYIAPVKDCSLYLDPRGIWTLTYRLENCQWRGTLPLHVRILNKSGQELHTDKDSFFYLECHKARRASSGSYPAGLYDLIGSGEFTVQGGRLNVC